MAAPDPQTQLQAEMAPEFQIVRLLGEGAMARVGYPSPRVLL
jgi:hypothetical protein